MDIDFCDFGGLVPQSGRQWCDMFHAAVDMSKRLMTMSFAQTVRSEEMKSCLGKVRSLLVDIKPGFRLLTDLSSLESMTTSCATDLGEMMNLCNAKGISAVIRVVPDPRKDIGFTLMSQFHYGKQVDVTNYESLADAIQSLIPVAPIAPHGVVGLDDDLPDARSAPSQLGDFRQL
jgi:hypothetical protein